MPGAAVVLTGCVFDVKAGPSGDGAGPTLMVTVIRAASPSMSVAV